MNAIQPEDKDLCTSYIKNNDVKEMHTSKEIRRKNLSFMPECHAQTSHTLLPLCGKCISAETFAFCTETMWQYKDSSFVHECQNDRKALYVDQKET